MERAEHYDVFFLSDQISDPIMAVQENAHVSVRRRVALTGESL